MNDQERAKLIGQFTPVDKKVRILKSEDRATVIDALETSRLTRPLVAQYRAAKASKKDEEAKSYLEQQAGGRNADPKPESAKPGERDLMEELRKKDLMFRDEKGYQHRIHLSKKTGFVSCSDTGALAKFAVASGWTNFNVTQGSAENATQLIKDLHKAGLPNVTMTTEIREKVSVTADGPKLIQISDAKHQAFEKAEKNPSSRSVNAEAYASMNTADTAAAREYLNNNFMTQADRNDVLDILIEKKERGLIDDAQFKVQTVSLLEPTKNNPEEQVVLLDKLDPDSKAHAEKALGPTPKPEPSAEKTALAEASAPPPSAPPGPFEKNPPEPSPDSATAPMQNKAPNTPAPGRPAWTETGLTDCRKICEKQPLDADRAQALADAISSKMDSRNNKLGMNEEGKRQYLEGVKNFLNGPENKSNTKFNDVAAEMMTSNPANIKPTMENLSKKELKEVIHKVKEKGSTNDENNTKANNAFDEMDKNLPAWKEKRPNDKSSEKKPNDSSNKAPKATPKSVTGSTNPGGDKSPGAPAEKTADTLSKARQDMNKNLQEKKANPNNNPTPRNSTGR